jgi:glycosyltransferase involved in cell wall biosynthesis
MDQHRESVSIIICFYNAEDKLDLTLSHIKALKIPKETFVELLLINNCSTDRSVEVVNNTLQGFDDFPWRIIYEQEPGLTNARYCGLNHSKGNTLLFCDDDNWLAEDYLIQGLAYLNSNENIAVLGGHGTPVSTIAIPDWFAEVQNFYACGPQFSKNGKVRGVRNVVYGAGMFVVKKHWLDLISRGYKPFSSDRKGTELSSGGDSELCLAFQIAGFEIHYSSHLIFKHQIEPNRLTKVYLSKLQEGIQNSSFISRFYRDFLFGYRPRVNKLFWCKELIYTLKEIFLFKTTNIKRSIKFILLLLRERGSYDSKVKNIISICHKLSS